MELWMRGVTPTLSDDDNDRDSDIVGEGEDMVHYMITYHADTDSDNEREDDDARTIDYAHPAVETDTE